MNPSISAWFGALLQTLTKRLGMRHPKPFEDLRLVEGAEDCVGFSEIENKTLES
jgi:hypothetical protein